MKSRLLTSALALAVILLSSACGAIESEQVNKVTDVAAETNSKSCHRTGDFDTSITNAQNVGSDNQTPESSKVSITGTAQPYEQFYQGLLSFSTQRARSLALDTSVDLMKQSDVFESDITQYLHDELYGKHIANWQGWIVQTGTKSSIPYRGRLDPFNHDTAAVLISLSDPYTTTMSSPVSGEYWYGLPRTDWYGLPQLTGPYIIVANAAEASGQPLCLGQKVSIQGDVTWSPRISHDSSIITLPKGALTILGDNVAKHVTASGYEDIAISVRLQSGWSLDTIYEWTLYGDGTLVYFGNEMVEVEGYRITNIEAAEVQRIVEAFDQAGFDSMKDYPNGCCDFSTYYITLSRAGHTNQLIHNGGARPVSMKLIELEDKLREVQHISDWIH